jgi:hypothetical protein
MLRHWNGNKPGKIIDPGDGAANLLIRRGMAEVVRDEPDEMEPANRTEVETAARRPGRPKRLVNM